MKKVFSFTLILFFCLNAFCLNGNFYGEKKVKVIKTQYFDIIYSEKSELSAKKIASVADSYYSEIAEKLNTKMYQRFPVAITSAVENANAFFSVAPYNLIVVYDTYISESLDMSENTIQSTFYHELTHAVTINMKSGFWQGMSHFADFFTLSGISLTTFWYEGATVSLESRDSIGGRLNDPFSTQLVTIAKLKDICGEKKFPSWRDVTGARDTVPGGTDAYIFGATFAKYLQETYGMEKYSEFWKNAGTSFSLSFCAGVFKKTYKIKLSDAWKNFYDWIPIPNQNKEKLECLKTDKKNKRNFIKVFDVYHNPKNYLESQIVFYDSQSTAIFLSNWERTTKLFSISNVQKIQFSKDGKFLAITRFSKKSNIKSEVGIFDIKKNKYSVVKKTDSANAYFDIENNLKYYKIDELKNSNEFIFSPIQIDSNLSAKIIKENLNWKIRLESENEKFDFDFQNKIIHKLHLSENTDEKFTLTFTFAELGLGLKMLSRVGFIEIDKKTKKAKVHLQKYDFKTGILEAEILKKEDENLIFIFIVENYESNPIIYETLSISDFDFFEIEAKIKSNRNTMEEIEKLEKNEIQFETISYNPLRYYKNGVKLPVGLVSVYDFDFEQKSMDLLGFTFVSSNPWTDKNILFSIGVNPLQKHGGCYLNFSSKNDVFSYGLSGNVIFDKDGFKQTFDSVNSSFILWSGLINSVSLNANSAFFYGKEIESDNEKLLNSIHSKSTVSMTFSTLHKVAPEIHQIFGFYIVPFFLCEYEEFKFDLYKAKKEYLNVGATIGTKIPGIIPLTLQTSIFPSESVFISGGISATLLSLEIQKGIPFFSLYVDRFLLKTSYSCEIEYFAKKYFDVKRFSEILENAKREDFYDLLSLTALFEFSPNTSYFARSDVKFSFGGNAFYRPNPKLLKKKWGIGFILNANF